VLHGCIIQLTGAEMSLHVCVHDYSRDVQMQTYCSTRSLLKAQAGSSCGPSTFTSTPASALTMFVTSNLHVNSTN